MIRTLIGLICLLAASSAGAHQRVYSESNALTGNELLVLTERSDGTLKLTQRIPTGGKGTGAGLGSQGAVAVGGGGTVVAAVDAGSNEVALFFVDWSGPRLTDHLPSGGTTPVSVAIAWPLVYVLNSENVTSFRADCTGHLAPIGSQPLANPSAGPAQVGLTPLGDALVVTEKATNCIDVFALAEDGTPGVATCVPSAGMTPFGFAFAPTAYDAFGSGYDRVLVSEAFGGAAGKSALSSYVVSDAMVDVVNPSVATKQTAACWVALARGGRYAFTTNTGSGTVTGFRLHGDGSIRRLPKDGVSGSLSVGAEPIDAAVTARGRTLHVLDGHNHEVVSFFVGHDGSLTKLGTLTGLPDQAAGLAAAR